jgi:imidazolonepropionase-like amidohydrolase
VDFPAAYDVSDPYEAAQVRLADLKHWELAPTNAARVQAAGIPFALTTADLARKDDFWPNVRKAVSHGLSEEAALKALTWTPAELAGALDELGSLEKGKWASFLLTDGNIFSEKTKIFHNWVKGKPFVLKTMDAPDLAGRYGLFLAGAVLPLAVEAEGDGFKMTIRPDDTTEVKVTHQLRHGRISLSFRLPGQPGLTRLSGVIGQWDWKGSGQDSEGNWVDWSAQRVETESAEKPGEKKGRDGKGNQPAAQQEQPLAGPVCYPFTAFGWTESPKTETWLLRNATVWTNEADGVLEQADVLLRDGKIAAVGSNLQAPGAKVVDATGRHVTPGIIDEHTHIAVTRGVNEGTQASSAEVRIGDVLDSEDIDIYRQLSGGVTCAQVLHGSANPIGGQSAVIKLRWGQDPEGLKYDRASPFIKFALGENVKRSRSSSNDRFPDSRMGVAEVFEDHFTEARKYGERKRSGLDYRPDLELEALLEILEGKRFITCHSYVQSEINMLMHVAERHGFKVNTFTHILEGYKVADKMKAHGAGGSSFSDWWAYKYEVYEAIPHNGAIMHEQGVTVAFNSDDAEMARRLNQEAAKAVRFGGVSETEALKFVTLNPARLLHIDAYTGSLAPGKDADVVLWSDHPLSVYARADMTFVDGIPYFDREKDIVLRQAVAAERHRLIQRMLEVKKEGGRTQRAGWRRNGHYHCDSDLDEGNGADVSEHH